MDEVFEYTPPRAMYSHQRILYNKYQIPEMFNDCYTIIENNITLFENYGSGWILDRVIGTDIHVGKYKPLSGGCSIQIPERFVRKKCLINVVNNDNLCFKWAVLSILHIVKQNPHRPSSYKKFENLYDFNCIEFPVSVKSFPIFEDKNNIALNIFCHSEIDGVYPYYISKFNYGSHKKVDLLLLTDNHNHFHYTGIRSISKLLGKSNCHAKQLCYFCMQRFNTTETLMKHVDDCKQHKYQKILLPKSNEEGEPPKVSFKNFRNQLKAGFVVYADFESILSKRARKRLFKKTNTLIQTSHLPCGFSYAVVNDNGKLIRKKVYRGSDCVDLFLTEIQKISNLVMLKYSRIKDLDMSERDEDKFKHQRKCHICKRVFLRDETRVRDHCHLSGRFRGAAHQDCNLNFKQQVTLPVILHNFRGYDSHLIMKGFKNFGTNFNVIPSNSEKYTSITVDNITFLDSLQFLPHSLEKLVKSLESYGEGAFNILEQCFSKSECELLKRKGVYPYSYMESFKRFEETKLPDKKHFFVLTQNEHISNKDYKHAQNVFNFFKMGNLGDYHDLYLLTDSLLLACVFENFRTLCLKHYELDPVHYVSAPGIAWDAALKMTGVELEQMTDINMYLLMEKGIRGGISMISKRKSCANNHYMLTHNPALPSKYIMYLDCVNLYGGALRDPLPVGSFKWLTKSEIEELKISDIGDFDEFGYALEVTLEYPKELHDEHNDYCLAVDKMRVPSEQLSSYQKELLNDSSMKYNEKITKLIPHLGIHKNYVVHYRNLKYYLEKGLKLKKVHKVLKFRQKDWLRKFIDFNTQQRMVATSKIEDDLFKLFNNSVFGKTMQNNRKHMVVKIVNNPGEAVKLIRSPQFNRFDVLDDNLCTFLMHKKTVLLDRPIYCGFACLDLSKLIMYKFHYDKMKLWYGNKAQLLMTDTDSLCYEIETKDVYYDLSYHIDDFDFSEYDKAHPLFSEKNKRVVGKMKDEAHGTIIEEFVGLGAKSYSMIGTGVEKQSAKGVPRAVKEKLLKHEWYDRVITKQAQVYCTSASIRSRKHEIATQVQTKSAIHGFDSKRYIRNCGIQTYAWGHYKIQKMCNMA
jgi:hypothetical protein